MMTTVLTLRFNPLTGAFDNQSLTEFVKDKNLIEVRDHFFHHDGQPYLMMVITYRPGELLVPDDGASGYRSARREPNWRGQLSDNEGVIGVIWLSDRSNHLLGESVSGIAPDKGGFIQNQGRHKACPSSCRECGWWTPP